jgi:hypothetical protein
MDWSLCQMRKGTPNDIFHAKFQELVKEGRKSRIRGRIRAQSSIFSVEQEAIIDAIQKLPTTGAEK